MTRATATATWTTGWSWPGCWRAAGFDALFLADVLRGVRRVRRLAGRGGAPGRPGAGERPGDGGAGDGGGHRATGLRGSPCRSPTSTRTRWPAGSPRWTTSPRAASPGTWSPRTWTARRATWASASRSRTTSATSWPRSTSRSATSSGRAPGSPTRWSATPSGESSPTRPRCTTSSTRAATSTCRGRFLSEPSPQRTPVIFQAGASPRGSRFAGTHAEAVFVSGPNPGVVRRSVAGVRAAAEAAGRDPAAVKVFAMLTAIAGATDAEALAKRDSYLEYASHEGAMALFGGWTGVDLSEGAAGAAAGVRRDRRHPLRAGQLHHRRPGPGLDGRRGGPVHRDRRPRPGRGRLRRHGGRRDGALGRRGGGGRVQPGPTRSPRARSSTSSSTSCRSCVHGAAPRPTTPPPPSGRTSAPRPAPCSPPTTPGARYRR